MAQGRGMVHEARLHFAAPDLRLYLRQHARPQFRRRFLPGPVARPRQPRDGFLHLPDERRARPLPRRACARTPPPRPRPSSPSAYNDACSSWASDIMACSSGPSRNLSRPLRIRALIVPSGWANLAEISWCVRSLKNASSMTWLCSAGKRAQHAAHLGRLFMTVRVFRRARGGSRRARQTDWVRRGPPGLPTGPRAPAAAGPGRAGGR